MECDFNVPNDESIRIGSVDRVKGWHEPIEGGGNKRSFEYQVFQSF